jgi:hypothetical protein
MPHSAPRPELTPAASGTEGAGGGRLRAVGPATDLHTVRDGGARVEEDARNEQIPLQGKQFVFSIEGLSNLKSFWLSL